MKKQDINLKKLSGKNNRVVINNYYSSSKQLENLTQKVEMLLQLLELQSKQPITVNIKNNNRSEFNPQHNIKIKNSPHMVNRTRIHAPNSAANKVYINKDERG